MSEMEPINEVTEVEAETAPVATELAEEAPVEDPVVRDPVVEDPVTAEPVEEAPVDEASAAPAVEEPVEEAPAQEKTPEVSATEEVPVEGPAQEEAPEEPVVEDVLEAPVEEAAAALPTAEEAQEPAEEAVEAPEVEAAAEIEEAPAVDELPEEAEEVEEAAAATAPISVGVPGMDWYIIHTYSGFENKVKESLLSRAQAFGLEERIGELLIPTEDVVEMKDGKKVTSKRLLYPGYVLVQLKMDDELWHVVRNTPRVTSFVGSGQIPTPLADDEVNQILYRQTVSKEKPRPKMTFDHNDRVKIIDGPFSNFTGTVEEVNEDRSTIKVMVTIFGRGTPVELEYFQVEKEKV